MYVVDTVKNAHTRLGITWPKMYMVRIFRIGGDRCSIAVGARCKKRKEIPVDFPDKRSDRIRNAVKRGKIHMTSLDLDPVMRFGSVSILCRTS